MIRSHDLLVRTATHDLTSHAPVWLRHYPLGAIAQSLAALGALVRNKRAVAAQVIILQGPSAVRQAPTYCALCRGLWLLLVLVSHSHKTSCGGQITPSNTDNEHGKWTSKWEWQKLKTFDPLNVMAIVFTGEMDRRAQSFSRYHRISLKPKQWRRWSSLMNGCMDPKSENRHVTSMLVPTHPSLAFMSNL